MKLKEAQLLGILTLIVTGIVILCMWGGKGQGQEEIASSAAVQEDGQAAHGEPVVGTLDELLKIMADRADKHEATVEIEGVAKGRHREDSAIDEQLENVEPEDIPLVSGKDPVEAQPKPAPIIHVVQKGDTLSGISRKYYGSGSRRDWERILAANKSLIQGPLDLRPGMKLVIPPTSDTRVASAEARGTGVARLSASAAASEAKTYTVAQGDNLFRIAIRHYDDASAWKKILKANSDKLKKPQDLKAGMTIVLP